MLKRLKRAAGFLMAAVIMSSAAVNLSDVSVAEAATTTYTDDDGYTVDANGVLTGYSGSSTILSIPSSISGQSVTSIGDSAFKGNTTITVVTIPEISTVKLIKKDDYS